MTGEMIIVSCRISNVGKVKKPPGAPGGLQHKKDGDARRKFGIKHVRGTKYPPPSPKSQTLPHSSEL